MSLSVDRTPGTNLSKQIIYHIFSEHVPFAALKPKVLFAVKNISKSGHTSDWAACSKALPIISAILDESKGLIPRHRVLHEQFRSWMEDQKIDEWRIRDSESCITGLRAMMQTMLKYKRDSEKAPRRFSQLQILIALWIRNTKTIGFEIC